MPRIECFFDCSSPWTYLAFVGLLDLAERRDVAIAWRPILVGGVFNTINPSVYAAREAPVPAKAAYARKDLQDWARHVGVEIGDPPVFPANSVKAMRAALVADDAGLLVPWARAVFEAYWRDLEDIGRLEVLLPIAERVGLDTETFEIEIASPAIKDRLRANTESLIARGGFGSPTMFLDGDDMYFGNDRLPLLEAALDRGTA